MRVTPDSLPLRGRDLVGITARAGVEPRLSRPACYGRSVMEGQVACLEFPGGMAVHLTDGRETAEVTSSIKLPPRLTFAILMAGRVDFSIGERAFRLESRPQRVRCSALAVPTSLIMQRHLHPGNRIRKVHVSVSPEWLTLHCPGSEEVLINHALSADKEVPTWTASHRMAGAAEMILELAREKNHLQRLSIESHAMAIVAEGLKGLSRLAKDGEGQWRKARSEQIDAVRTYLDSHLHKPRDLASLAGTFGMSVSTLQRYFRQRTGTTVGEYIRLRRLEQARERLVSGDTSISEAAFAAGYRHNGNFISAYKKAFGCSPGKDHRQ